MHPSHGRSLIELMLVTAVAGTLGVLAIPAYAGFAADQRRVAALNTFVASAQTARSTAVLRRVTVTLCPRAAADRCGSDFSQGWLGFEDRDGDGHLDPGEPVVLDEAVRGVRISANRRVFSWRPWGRRATNGTLVFCPAEGEGPGRAVVVSHVGRPRSSARRADGQPLAC